LRTTQEFLDGILDNSPLPIYGVSEEGQIRLANRFLQTSSACHKRR
jgi:hypothetical protein